MDATCCFAENQIELAQLLLRRILVRKIIKKEIE